MKKRDRSSSTPVNSDTDDIAEPAPKRQASKVSSVPLIRFAQEQTPAEQQAQTFDYNSDETLSEAVKFFEKVRLIINN